MRASCSYRDFFSIFFLFVAGVSLSAQSNPATSHHHINSFLVNPALSGAQEGLGFTTGYRYQWAGIEGAPQTAYFFSDIALPAARSGAGVSIVFDKLGAYTFTGLGLSYAYRQQVSNWVLAFGVNAGITLQGLNGSKLVTPGEDYTGADPNHNDDILPTGKYNSLRPDLGAGLSATLPGIIEVGLSVQNLINSGTRIEGTVSAAKLTWGRTVHLHARADIQAGENFSVVPSLSLRTDFINFQSDLLVLVGYKNFLYTGLGYRGYNKNASGSLIPMIGFVPVKKLDIYYSYDAGISTLKNFSSGSHEISIKYRIPLKNEDKKPDMIFNPRYL